MIEGRVVFSEETVWDPYPQPDPQYHFDGIMDSLRQAMRAEIAAQLTPAHQERYRELVAGWERQRRPDTSNAKSGDAK